MSVPRGLVGAVEDPRDPIESYETRMSGQPLIESERSTIFAYHEYNHSPAENGWPGSLDAFQEFKEQPASGEDDVMDEDAPFQANGREEKVRAASHLVLETQETQQEPLPKGFKKQDTRANSGRQASLAKPAEPPASVANMRATRSRTSQKLSAMSRDKNPPSDQVVSSSPLSLQEDTVEAVVLDADNQPVGTMQRDDRQGSIDWPSPHKTKSPITCEQIRSETCSSLMLKTLPVMKIVRSPL